jgi:indole-3-glycerol phosphate synthase
MILDDIIRQKKAEVEKLKKSYEGKDVASLAKDLPKPRNFAAAFKKGKLSLIAEIKKASPSAGVIRDKFDPITLAKTYEESGASAISVLTDQKFFQGSLEHIKAAKESTTIPVLRKDFIVDESQIYESRIAGADAILLIVRILTDEQIKKFIKLAEELGLSSLVEVHSKKEAERAIATGAEIIGINNRDLSNFKVNLKTTIDILKAQPALKDKIIVSESGINSGEDTGVLAQSGVDAILVGESLLKSKNIGEKISKLLNRQ